MQSNVTGAERTGLSIQERQVICLECGKTLQLLSHRHLATHHLTPEEYKLKHGLTKTQPLYAYALQRRLQQLSQTLGVGQQ